MKYRTLGKTGMAVSVVGIGTWQLGGEWGQDFTDQDAEEIIEAGRECGINFIDTAECYGDHLSEKLVGKAIHRDREKWFVATKFGHLFTKPFERDPRYDIKSVEQQLNKSLKALDSEYIDLYQFHSGPDEAFDNNDLWDFLNGQKDAGKIRHIGLSISPNDNIYQTEGASAVGAETIQIVYNRLDRKAQDEVLPACARQSLGVLARVPLASGLLSGKYKPGHAWAANDVRSKWGLEKNQEGLREVMHIAATEVPAGVAMADWALAWCLEHPSVCLVIPGCKSAEQVRSNARAADLAMVRDDHPWAVKAE